MQQDDVHAIAGDYALTEVEVEPFDGGANSSFALHAREGEYVLTVFDEKSLAEVDKVGKLLQLLADHGFPTTRILQTREGALATMFGDKPVMVKEYIDGQVVMDLDAKMVSQVGAAMARLHKVPSPDYMPDEHAYGRQAFSQVIGRKINPEYETWLSNELAHLESNIPSGLPKGLIHGDMFYDNVLFEDEDLKAVIDFEEACCYYKVFDVGMGIVGLCADGTTIDLHRARALVDGYQQVQRMNDEEREALQTFVEYAATATSFWRFRRFNIDTPTAERANHHQRMVRLAEDAHTIPKAKFTEVVFG
ncbi:MAG: homoserine kinase [Armatimonadetes bacterium]|nr:homoserine kinase [Armatimonadota bacterium]